MSTQLTVEQVKQLLTQSPSRALLSQLEEDSRVSVKKMLEKWRNREKAHKQELSRLKKLYKYEEEFYKQGCHFVAGVDEAGRGPLAGPVVVGAVILPARTKILKLNDSKQLSAKVREELYTEIKHVAISTNYKIIDVNIIDQFNIYQATVLGMYEVLSALEKIDAALIDAVPLKKLSIPSLSIINGDALSASIAAASIIAKVERDRIMCELDKVFPQYGFAKHKGYATREHLCALQTFGPSPVHRRSFAPIKDWEDANNEHKRDHVRTVTKFNLFDGSEC